MGVTAQPNISQHNQKLSQHNQIAHGTTKEFTAQPWLRGDGTYLWLSGSSLKKECMAAMIPFSVPRSVTRSTGQPPYSLSLIHI